MKLVQLPPGLSNERLDGSASIKHNRERMLRAPALDAVQVWIDERCEEQRAGRPDDTPDQLQQRAGIILIHVREHRVKPDDVESGVDGQPWLVLNPPGRRGVEERVLNVPMNKPE